LKARTKTVVRYADNLWETRWHDGNKLSLADFIFAFILGFDRANRKAQFSRGGGAGFKNVYEPLSGARILEKIRWWWRSTVIRSFRMRSPSLRRAHGLYTNVPGMSWRLGYWRKEIQLAFPPQGGPS
jgi:hypothetical protein